MTNDQIVVDLLTRILKVQAMQIARNEKSITDGARLLKLAGLDNQMIAEVLNTSTATIRTLTANLRASGRTTRRGGRSNQ